MLNRKWAGAIGAWLLAATPAMAQQTPRPMFTDADRTAALATIDHYFEAFTRKDYVAFAQALHAPFVTQAGGQYLTEANTDVTVERYQRIRNPLDQTDYAHSKAAEVRMTPLSSASVLANVHWQRLKKDNSLLSEGAEVIMLGKFDGEWKITGVIGEDLREFKAGR